MITALIYSHTNGFKESHDLDEARAALEEPDTVLWLDLEGESCEAIQRMGRLFSLNEGAIDDADDDDQRPRIDDYGDYLFVLLYAALAPADPPVFAPRQLALFLSRNYLISVHNHPIRAIKTGLDRAKRMPERAIGRGLDYKFFHIVDYLVDNFVVCAEHYEEILDDIDERSMDPDVSNAILVELTHLQRVLMRMRRMVGAERELAAEIANGEYDFIGPEVDRRFDHIYQHLTHTFELVEGMRETGHSIRDNFYAVLAERTNALMRTLTIFSTFIMPLTLITGVYGMNVDLWPSGDSPLSFIFVCVLMGISAVCMFIYFRKRKWI